MEAIKTSENVEFDVIYADGTRRHVTEGVLFEAKDSKLTFHNGTDRPETLIGVAQAAAEIVGLMGLPEQGKALLIYNIQNRIYGRIGAAADMKTTKGGQNNGI